MCVPAVIGALAVWQQNKTKQKPQMVRRVVLGGGVPLVGP